MIPSSKGILCTAGRPLRRRKGVTVAHRYYCAAFTICSSVHRLASAFVTSSPFSAAQQVRRCHRIVPAQSSPGRGVSVPWNRGTMTHHPLRFHRHRPPTRRRSSPSSPSPPPPSMGPVGDGDPPRWKLFDKGATLTLKEYVSQGPSSTNVQIDRNTNNDRRQTTNRICGSDAGATMAEGDWLSASGDLAASLGISPAAASEAEHRRVFHLYLPVYFWLKGLLQLHRDTTNSSNIDNSNGDGRATDDIPSSDQNSSPAIRPAVVVVGVSAPQGCGKSTLVGEMQRMLEKAGHSCTAVSIDDFYLTGAEQVRGNAGTHDLTLGLRTLRALSGRAQSGSGGGDGGDGDDESGGNGAGRRRVVRVPRYDKSARGGRGDRAPEGEWGVVSTPPEVVLLEGWMLGFDALPDGSPLLAEADIGGDGGAERGLEVVNKFLGNYRELHDEVDAWLVLKTADPEMVFEWRAEAERRMREAGRSGMSDDQVRDFCSRYMPAYRAYLPGLYDRVSTKRGGEGGDAGRHGVRAPGEAGCVREGGLSKALVIEVGRDRNPIL